MDWVSFCYIKKKNLSFVFLGGFSSNISHAFFFNFLFVGLGTFFRRLRRLNRFIANTLWVMNGIFAVWPNLYEDDESISYKISYWTGVIGAFLFIVTGYLGIVEVINQNSGDILLPPDDVDDDEHADDDEVGHHGPGQDKNSPPQRRRRALQRPQASYGQFKSPIHHATTMTLDDLCSTVPSKLRHQGYPIVVDVETGHLVTRDTLSLMDDDVPTPSALGLSSSSSSSSSSPTDNELAAKVSRPPPLPPSEGGGSNHQGTNSIMGHTIDVVIGNHVLQATITNCFEINPETVARSSSATSQGEDRASPTARTTTTTGQHHRSSSHTKKYYGTVVPNTPSRQYVWWTRHPDMNRVSVFGAYVFFVSTIIFFIPAVVWWPFEQNEVTNIGVNVFFVYFLQMVPSIGFIFVGHVAMAESTGSWCYTCTINRNIGYWIGLFNTLGGWGFLLYPILALPGAISVLDGGDGCCASLTKWGAAFATFWGSCSFWIAGVLECIEFANQHPINISTKQKRE